jgi:hypothetical protein
VGQALEAVGKVRGGGGGGGGGDGNLTKEELEETMKKMLAVRGNGSGWWVGWLVGRLALAVFVCASFPAWMIWKTQHLLSHAKNNKTSPPPPPK